MSSRVALAALVVVCSFAQAAHAGPTFYVRTSGNDGADGFSPATAKRTIRAAAREAGKRAAGGQVVVGPGIYIEGNIAPPTSSALSKRVGPLEFIADRDGSQTGDPAGPVVVDAAGVPTGFLVYGEANVRIDGFHVRGASDGGIQVRYNRGANIASANVTIVNCVVFSNGKRGIDVQDTAGAVVFNNLTYANGASGISVGGDGSGSKDAVIAQNTSYGNSAYGIFVGEGNRSTVASSGALVLSNVVQANQLGGIKVAPASQESYSSAYNVNADTFEPVVAVDPTDRATAPLLVNPAGLDGLLGGTHFVDDDFHLRSDSPAVDYGPTDAATAGVTGSTRTDGVSDQGTVDAGYHYGGATSQFPVPAIPLVPIFVRASGSDGNDGSSPTRALRTIRYAATLARAGNRIVVGAGLYSEGDINLQDRSGTAYRPIEFVADSDGTLTHDAGPVVVDAGSHNAGGAAGALPTYQTGFNILGSSHVTIDGFTVRGGYDSGIQIRARPSDQGLRGADHVMVCNSQVTDNAGSGILVRDSASATIFNNLVYANGTGGVAVGGLEVGSPQARVVNNTVHKNGGNGVLIGNSIYDDRVGSPGALVMNNILDQNAQRSLLVTPLSLQDYSGAANLDSAAVGPINFVNPEAADFHLQQRPAGQLTTSVAVDRGVAAAAAMGLDRGTTRSDLTSDAGLADVGFHYGLGNNVRPVAQITAPLQARLALADAGRLLFVGPDGDDGHDGLSAATAWHTIAKAADQAVPGDRVVVAPGRYYEGDIVLNNSGTALKPIVFLGDRTGALSAVAPGDVVIDATNPPRGTAFTLLKRNFVQIRGFHIAGAHDAAIQARPCAGQDVSCSTTDGSDHVTIADNVIFSGHRGIDIVNSADATIFNNLIYANDSTGIDIIGDTRPAAFAQLVNNTLYRNGGDAVLLDGDVGAPNAGLINNLIQDSGLNGIKTNPNSRTGLVLTHNINRDGVNAGTPSEIDDPGADPQFVRPAGLDGILAGAAFADDDFHLDIAGSPAINASGFDASDVALSAEVAGSDGRQDDGHADLGFHYLQPGPLASAAEPVQRIYVRASMGDDANDGQTPATALRTIGRAAAQAGAGTTVVIGPGVYRESNLRPIGDGTVANLIAFVGDRAGTITGDAPGPVLVDARGASLAFRLAGKKYLRVSDVDVTGAQLAGILLQNTTAVDLVNCRVFSNSGTGVMIVRPRGANTLFNDLIYANGRDGVQIRLPGVRDTALRVVNNTIYGNGGRGVWIERSAVLVRQGALLLAHNVIQSNGAAGDLVVRPGGWPTLRVFPNVLSRLATGVTASTLTIEPPVFATPAGPDAVLGGVGFADDDFRVEGGVASIVDAGIGSAARWGLDQRTVRRDGGLDQGSVDLGYHSLP